MRWLPFFILAYVVLGLQLGFGSFVSLAGGVPNLALIAVVFVALNAPRDAGLMGAFLIGLGQDLLTAGPIGPFALCYGLVGLMVSGARASAYADHPITHVAFTLAGGLVTAAVLYLHVRLHPPGGDPTAADDGSALPPLGVGLWPLVLSAVYSAALAPAVLWAFGRAKPLFGFRTARPRW
jgi:rod shape-determining protein MreD